MRIADLRVLRRFWTRGDNDGESVVGEKCICDCREGVGSKDGNGSDAESEFSDSMGDID